MKSSLQVLCLSTFLLMLCTCNLDRVPGDYVPVNTYAVLVGISYADLGETEPFRKLTYTIHDALDVQQALLMHGADSHRIRILVSDESERVTRTRILEQFDFPDMRPEDQLLFFFAGHGHDDGNGTYQIITEEEDGTTGNITNWDLQNLSKELPGRFMIILDSCRSGGFIPANRYDYDSLYALQNAQYPWSEAFTSSWNLLISSQKDTAAVNFWVMSASGYHEDSMEPEPGFPEYDRHGNLIENGVFTHHLLQGLHITDGYAVADINRDRVLLLSELYWYVLQEFKAAQYGYLPHISGSPRDLIFSRY